MNIKPAAEKTNSQIPLGHLMLANTLKLTILEDPHTHKFQFNNQAVTVFYLSN